MEAEVDPNDIWEERINSLGIVQLLILIGFVYYHNPILGITQWKMPDLTSLY